MITLSPVEHVERFPGDKLAYDRADILRDGRKIGSVHTNGYAPRWAFSVNEYRWQQPNELLTLTSDSKTKWYGLLFDGAAWDTAETALAVAVAQIERFETMKAAK